MLELLKQSKPIAAKEHRCMFCGETIKIGERYNRDTIIYDGTLYDWITHQECTYVSWELDMIDKVWDEGITEEDFKEFINRYVYDNHYDNDIDDIAKDWQLNYYELAKMILKELKEEGIFR